MIWGVPRTSVIDVPPDPVNGEEVGERGPKEQIVFAAVVVLEGCQVVVVE